MASVSGVNSGFVLINIYPNAPNNATTTTIYAVKNKPNKISKNRLDNVGCL